MNATIDLTENRDFRKSISITSLPMIRKKIPWSMSYTYINEEDINELFYTGSKEERLKKKNHYLFENGLICERCGSRLETLPWKKTHYGLCYACDKALDLEFVGKRLWGEFYIPSQHQEVLPEIDIADLDEMFLDEDLR